MVTKETLTERKEKPVKQEQKLKLPTSRTDTGRDRPNEIPAAVGHKVRN